MPAPPAAEDELSRCQYCFNTPCLLSQGLYQSLIDLEDSIRMDEEDGSVVLTNEQIRFRLYWHATSWIHGFLGKGKRIKLPQCIQGEIRDLAPKTPRTTYTGFKRSRDEEEETPQQEETSTAARKAAMEEVARNYF